MPENTHFENSERPVNPFENSVAFEKIQASKRIAFFDIDSTITGNPQVAEEIRSNLEGAGFVFAEVTSRTEEMIMSKSEYEKSVERGFNRPAPHLGTENGKRVYVPPEKMPDTPGILDPDIISASSGTRILVRQKDGGYEVDKNFEADFGTAEEWRARVLNLIASIDPEGELGQFPAFELPGEFENGNTDVYSPDYRIQVDFTGTNGLKKKQEFLERMTDVGKLGLRVTDDSNPQKGRYSMYITPLSTGKPRAIESMINKLTETTGIDPEELEILIAGDSFPDLLAALKSGTGLKNTFLLANGSRLKDLVADEENDIFAGQKMYSFKDRLKATETPGLYMFKQPLGPERKIIVLDEMFPEAKGPEGILEYIKKSYR
jgi:hypothetical protein